jgi:hypothetical protein
MTLELTNKSLRYWCFEESIDKDSILDKGISIIVANMEIIKILNYLKDNEQYDNTIISKVDLESYIKIFENTYASKKGPYEDYLIKNDLSIIKKARKKSMKLI